MEIYIDDRQKRWLERQVADGVFPSVDEAVRLALDGLIDDDTDDLAWAQALVEPARAEFAEGKGVDLEKVKASISARLDALDPR